MTKLGIVVDGQAEFRSFGMMLPRIDSNMGLIKPLYADIQPRSSAKKIVRSVLPAVRILSQKGAQKILVLIDNENRSGCIPDWSAELEQALAIPCQNAGVKSVNVVLKVQMYENWLVSDPSALKAMRARFCLSPANESRIIPNKADHVDALRILKSSAQGSDYHKIQDSIGIMSRLDPLAGARNSRSFRRFLRLAGCPSYSQQSKLPA